MHAQEEMIEPGPSPTDDLSEDEIAASLGLITTFNEGLLPPPMEEGMGEGDMQPTPKEEPKGSMEMMRKDVEKEQEDEVELSDELKTQFDEIQAKLDELLAEEDDEDKEDAKDGEKKED